MLVCGVAVVYVAVQILGRFGLQILTTLTVGATTAAYLFLWWVGMCVFPVCAYFETDLKKTLRNAAFITFRHRRQSIGSVLIMVAPVLLFLLLPKYFVMTAAFWLLIYPGVAAYIVACRFAPVFLEYDRRRKEKEEANGCDSTGRTAH